MEADSRRSVRVSVSESEGTQRAGDDPTPFARPADNHNTNRNTSALGAEKGRIMTTLARWTPFREMEDLQTKLNSIFGLSAARQCGTAEEGLKVPDWTPLVDITEDDKEFVIKAELPDLPREAVVVKVENGILTLSGERKFEQEEKGKRYHRVERVYGRFARSFRLPEDTDPEKVSAEFRDGVLRVRLPKNEKARTKSIEVKVS